LKAEGEMLRQFIFEKKTVEEIADAFNLSPSNVRVRISRAKKSLLRILVRKDPDMAGRWQRIGDNETRGRKPGCKTKGGASDA